MHTPQIKHRVKNFAKQSLFLRNLYKKYKSALAMPKYLQDWLQFSLLRKKQGGTSEPPIRFWPCLLDKTPTTKFDRHYIYHTAWAARILRRTQPLFHTDIASSLYFASIVSAFIPVEFYDYRPPHISLDQLHCQHADLLQLPFLSASLHSLSCMHVIEHVGLGRYGDPLDYLGDIKAMEELQRVLAPGGNLLLVIPMGAPQIFFNAHRVYSPKDILRIFSPLSLQDFYFIPDDISQHPIHHPSDSFVLAQNYGCGCFWFQKS